MNNKNSLKIIYSIISLCFIVFSQTAWAGKIYRWTDSEGNVQFTSTPGPNQSADADQGSTSKRHQETDYSIEDIFTGSWYGSNRTLSINLYFHKKSDTLRWEGRPRGGGIKAENFTARWKYVNSDLELLYISYKEEPQKAGSKELVKIIEKSSDVMMLQFPNGNVFKLHKRIKRKRLSQSERGFRGKWQLNDKQKTEWHFNSRGFLIKGITYGQYNHQTLASGNWKVEGDDLILTHLNDRYVWKGTKKTGQVEKFNILLLEQGKAILKPVDSAEQIVLHRKR